MAHGPDWEMSSVYSATVIFWLTFSEGYITASVVVISIQLFRSLTYLLRQAGKGYYVHMYNNTKSIPVTKANMAWSYYKCVVSGNFRICTE